MKAKWFRSLLIVVLLVIAIAPVAGAAPQASDDGPIFAGKGGDNLLHPKGEEQAALRATAMESKLQQKTEGPVAKVAEGKYVELEVERNDRVFVILAEFGDNIHPSYGGSAGPQHNEIAEPNRAVDNSTIWQADYSPAHYEDMYFNQMVDYYQKQSSGRYTINGDVIAWVRVHYNEARYGSNFCGSNVCSTTWYLIRDAVNQWVADQKAAGMTNEQIYDYLATFDLWDRYDIDGDANFDEPDGYIDHFQIVHAGEGEETGGGAQGSDAIWSHRWYTAYQGIGSWGPPQGLQGGMEFGGDGTFGNLGGPNAVGIWIGDYTIQPENGGLGVFAHEYGHDLGLPDLYDTSGGENSTGFWTLMSSGSYLGNGKVDIGSRPGDLGAWEKFQLGWLDYDVAFAGEESVHKLGPAEVTSSNAAQALFVVLPDKEVTVDLADPYAGSYFYYSGAGDDIDHTMTRSVTLPGGSITLTAQVNYQIETDWDYAYLTVNGDPVETNLSTDDSPNGQNFGHGITGASGGWVELTADLSAFAGQTVDIGFRYWTDGAVVEPGFMVDELSIPGQAVDGAESDAGWTFDGFSVTTGSETAFFFNAYVAEFRQYIHYDAGLRTGPYNFGFLNTMPDWVQHFPYQDGLLISYWDDSFSDNNTSQHPGGGLILPIDAHPHALYRPDGAVWRARVQTYDATFTLSNTDKIKLSINGVAQSYPSLPGVSVFDDMVDFWDPATPLANVITPDTGTTISIDSISGGKMWVTVNGD